MPPDVIESVSFSGSESDSLAVLVAAGLLEVRSSEVFSMHRLLGNAIRHDMGQSSAAAAAERVLGFEPSVRSLTRFAELSQLDVLRDALGDSPSGRALWGLATIEEMHDGKASPLTFERAAMILDPHIDADRGYYADCLHSRGRVVNQEKNPPPDRVRWAIEQVEQAIALRDPDEEIAIAKHQAIQALLRQRIVRIHPKGSAERLAELNSICDALDTSYERRKSRLGETDPLVDRAYFNRAGVRIMLCQEDVPRRATHLEEAELVYRTTLSYRRAFYSMPSPLTAASIAGIATWGYFAALYDIAEDPQNTLSEAMAAGLEALEIRKDIENEGDIVKSAGSLTKLNLLQARLAGGRLFDTLAESFDELGLRLDDFEEALRAADG